MAVIPTIETERLILSGPTSTDFPDIAAMWADPIVVRHIGGVPAGALNASYRVI